jgi:hypothetical protein
VTISIWCKFPYNVITEFSRSIKTRSLHLFGVFTVSKIKNQQRDKSVFVSIGIFVFAKLAK